MPGLGGWWEVERVASRKTRVLVRQTASGQVLLLPSKETDHLKVLRLENQEPLYCSLLLWKAASCLHILPAWRDLSVCSCWNRRFTLGQWGLLGQSLGQDLVGSCFVLSPPPGYEELPLPSQDLEPQEMPQEMESNLVIEQGSWVRQKVLQIHTAKQCWGQGSRPSLLNLGISP